MKILIIGGGNMGSTYARSFLKSLLCDHEHLMILEKSAPQRAGLQEHHKGRVYTDAAECVPQADLIILAVKPQDTEELFASLGPIIQPSQVVLSIMDGIKIEFIQKSLGITKVIRAMPNLPAQVGMGLTVFTSAADVTRIELVTVQNLLNTTGKSIYVEQESLLDASTAISGSGPAYVFYFMQSMMDAAHQMGFSAAEADLLVHQTFRGAIELFVQNDLSCAEWIKRVASRGGTTEAALKQFEEDELNDRIQKGAFAALRRAQELGAKK